MKLWLDDVRDPPDDGWNVVRSYAEFIQWLIQNGLPGVVSFDHDLGEGPSGYDAAKWMIEHYGMPRIWYVHSMNYHGCRRIRELLNAACLPVF